MLIDPPERRWFIPRRTVSAAAATMELARPSPCRRLTNSSNARTGVTGADDTWSPTGSARGSVTPRHASSAAAVSGDGAGR